MEEVAFVMNAYKGKDVKYYLVTRIDALGNHISLCIYNNQWELPRRVLSFLFPVWVHFWYKHESDSVTADVCQNSILQRDCEATDIWKA